MVYEEIFASQLDGIPVLLVKLCIVDKDLIELKLNKIMIWRPIKIYTETGNISDRPGQSLSCSATTKKLIKFIRGKHRRNLKEFKYLNCN